MNIAMSFFLFMLSIAAIPVILKMLVNFGCAVSKVIRIMRLRMLKLRLSYRIIKCKRMGIDVPDKVYITLDEIDNILLYLD